MKLRPTWSEPFASPFGCLLAAEESSSFALFAAPHETTMISPANVSSRPSTLATTLVTAVPLSLLCSRTASAPVSSVTFGCSIAGRTPITSASAFACTRQGNPSQLSQRTHLLNGMFDSPSMIPQGAWNGCSPALAKSSESCWIRGSCDTGGNGYSALAGGSVGSSPCTPCTW